MDYALKISVCLSWRLCREASHSQTLSSMQVALKSNHNLGLDFFCAIGRDGIAHFSPSLPNDVENFSRINMEKLIIHLVILKSIDSKILSPFLLC